MTYQLRIRANTSLTTVPGIQPPYATVPPNPNPSNVLNQLNLSGPGVTQVTPGIYNVAIPANTASVDVQIKPANNSNTGLMWFELAAIASPADGSYNGVVNLQLVDNGGLTTGPVINDLWRYGGGVASDLEYVELKTQANKNLAPYVIAFFDSTGAVTTKTELTGMTAGSTGFFLLGGSQVLNIKGPASSAGYSILSLIDVPDDGAVAVYKNPAPGTALDLTNIRNNLLDVVVYGSVSGSWVRKFIGVSQSPLTAPSVNSPFSISRSSDGGAFRDQSLFITTRLKTPALPNAAPDSPRKAYWVASGASGGDFADPDLDDIDNLSEYAFGLNPALPYLGPVAAPKLPDISFNSANSSTTMTVYVPTPAGNDPAITYKVEYSTNLAAGEAGWQELPWDSSPGRVDTNKHIILGQTGAFTATYTPASGQENAAVFLRAKIISSTTSP